MSKHENARRSPAQGASGHDHQTTNNHNFSFILNNANACVKLQDSLVSLANKTARLAARSGSASHARAATYLSDAAHLVWLANEALAEGVQP